MIEQNYNTNILPCNDENIKIAAKLLSDGEIVAIPTETVYGLAADATNPEAVAKIFKAKGRPQDNPLIVHISSPDEIERYATEIPDLAYKLFEEFSPGPLTIILKKREIIPRVTSGGLNTVGIRIPDNEYIRRLIKLLGKPLAAPSANISGYPSPTEANHVKTDLDGKIPLILDGGVCRAGLESTVITIKDEQASILRPGVITAEDLSRFCEVAYDKGVFESITPEKAQSPGMKYKHYAPKCEITLVKGTFEHFKNFLKQNGGKDFFAAVPDGFDTEYPNTITYEANNLFSLLRKADDDGIKKIWFFIPESGVDVAVYNRLVRAAGFRILEV
ncbi:MAG: threonylcarbamoyl-AMP synthase [Ruminococcus sp.]|jgi:L-threonylcarbamoyladenylate synthase|nr:threonylcarbamoyl-AMP synthase [Ruminococcus sp.]